MDKTLDGWDKLEWEAMKARLRKLSLEQLRAISNKAGIIFTGGNDVIRSKESFISVLDEISKEKLEKLLDGYEH